VRSIPWETSECISDRLSLEIMKDSPIRRLLAAWKAFSFPERGIKA
jgi:hypothetical protein